nr:translation initiation factor IF-2-like [Pongo pygmaeus]
MGPEFLPSGGFVDLLTSGVKLHTFALDTKVLQVPTHPRSPAGFTSHWHWQLCGTQPGHSGNPQGARPRQSRGKGEARKRQRPAIVANNPVKREQRSKQGTQPLIKPSRHQPAAQSVGLSEPVPTQNPCLTASAAQPQLPPVPLPSHFPGAEGAGSSLRQPQRGDPTAQPWAEGLLKRGQSGHRGGPES